MLTIHDLNIRFRQPGSIVHAVRGCSLEIGEGEIVGLVGESGCGKSLTALACLGLVPDSAEISGSIEVCGRQIANRTDAELEGLRGGVAAMIFQNPMAAMNPFFTIERQICDAVRSHSKQSASEARAVALDALSSVHIPDPRFVLGKYPHQLSGGQLQRVMIAMAMACKPRLLIADEPTTALDVTVQAQVLVLIRELAAQNGLTILFITHDLGVVATVCDRVSVMYAGRVVESGPVDRIFAGAEHPYTRKLMQTVPTLGARHDRLNSIKGQVPDLSRRLDGCAFADRCDKATDVCRRQIPALRTVARNHDVACHNSDGTLKLKTINRWNVA